jgi:hypothetical protein
MSTPEFDEFIDTLEQLKNCGGNYHFELRLHHVVKRTGKTLQELTVREFLDAHATASREYNDLMDLVAEQKKES